MTATSDVTQTRLLGDIELKYSPFPRLEEHLTSFTADAFKQQQARKRFKQVNKTLLLLINEASEPCFLLPAVIDFIGRVNALGVLHEPYKFASFEFWLNQFSNLSPEENLKIRAKIAGKSIPRLEYQSIFPIGTGTYYPGTHYVASHASPDIDTTVASLWGWLDAFSARVAEGTHQWSLTRHPRDSHVVHFFSKVFSPYFLSQVGNQATVLSMAAQDLVTQKNVVKLQAYQRASQIEHALADKAVIVVDNEGRYMGDWRVADSEAVRQVIILFSSLMRWFESSIQSTLINILSKDKVSSSDVASAIEAIFETILKNAEPILNLSERQRRFIGDYLRKVLAMPKGLNGTFMDLAITLDELTSVGISNLPSNIEALGRTTLFDKSGALVEARPQLFEALHRITSNIQNSIERILEFIERLDMLLEVKDKVLGNPPHFVTLKSDVEEIRSKIDSLDYLTVVIPEQGGAWFPVGIIHASEVKKNTLGTVSMRDFSNEEEVRMASYFETISIMDHHKSHIRTSQPACIHIGDVQSANIITAEESLKQSDSHSTLGITKATIDAALSSLSPSSETPQSLYELQSYINLKLNGMRLPATYIHPTREFTEYLSYIYAILDDTDLLTKVTPRDVEIIAKLLNAMKSIASGRIATVVSLCDLPRDKSFAKAAALRILKQPDMYSIYKKIYACKEEEMAAIIVACVEGKTSDFFADTKEQNGCCRVGQAKMFSCNFATYLQHANKLRTIWLDSAKHAYEANSQIDFHLQMISTIAGADEVYFDKAPAYTHKDEMWLWVPATQRGSEHLINFCNAFQGTAAAQNSSMSVEIAGPNWRELEQIFAQNFGQIPRTIAQDTAHGLPIAILRYEPGAINSRKAQITPYLPRFVI